MLAPDWRGNIYYIGMNGDGWPIGTTGQMEHVFRHTKSIRDGQSGADQIWYIIPNRAVKDKHSLQHERLMIKRLGYWTTAHITHWLNRDGFRDTKVKFVVILQTVDTSNLGQSHYMLLTTRSSYINLCGLIVFPIEKWWQQVDTLKNQPIVVHFEYYMLSQVNDRTRNMPSTYLSRFTTE